MDDMQSQMNAILSDPEMMQRIKAMAQSLNLSPASGDIGKPSKEAGNSGQGVDMAMLQKLSGIAGQSNIDANQQSLLSALSPYLSHHRLEKLEKAMRAARMASMASAFLGSSGLLTNPGR